MATFPKLNISQILPAFYQPSCVVHRLYQHEELSYLVVYVTTVPSNNTYLVFLLQEKKRTFIFVLNDILLSFKPGTTESPTINVFPFFHTSESGTAVNQFGSIFSRACSGTQILFVSKFSRFLFWKSLTLAIGVLNYCMTFSK